MIKETNSGIQILLNTDFPRWQEALTTRGANFHNGLCRNNLDFVKPMQFQEFEDTVRQIGAFLPC
jgi:hypothetical protein